MEQLLIDAGLANSIWCGLFIFLLIYTITDSRKRETKYQETIKNLSDNFGVVKEIKRDVDEIKDKIFKN